MQQRILLAACWLGAASLSITSVSAQVGAPQLGWVPDGTSFRPVYGMPAAAAVGAPVPSDQNFSQIAASQARDYVLVSAADTGAVLVYTLEHGLVPLDGAGGAPDSMVLSPGGSSAALWFAALNRLQIVTGLPDTPAIRQLDVPFPGSASGALAVSDDGAWVAGIWDSVTYAFGPGGDVNRLPVDNAKVLAFFQGTHNLAAAGPAGVQLVTGVDGFAAVSNLLTSADASLQPVAVAATSGNRTVVLADHTGSLTAIDIATGIAATSDCGCQPDGLIGIGPTAFRLTGLTGGAFKLFDAASGEILFAPVAFSPPQADAAGAGQ
jgi:hypothetical protein